MVHKYLCMLKESTVTDENAYNHIVDAQSRSLMAKMQLLPHIDAEQATSILSVSC